jgi:hypothetical protein
MKKIDVDFKFIIRTTMMYAYLNVSFAVVAVWMWQLKKNIDMDVVNIVSEIS